MLEILAPAGNEEAANAAINNGANAIYLGYSAFSARQSAENFSLETLKNTVLSAHFRGVKVYVAMNTVVKQKELQDFVSTFLSIWETGVDAIILQDLFLGKALHKKYPSVVLHLSTQAGVCNENGAKIAKECGFSRVILARETPIQEIEKITKIIETEVFVQGALCTCYSGQCYFSSFAGGNSGNRGRCKQPCRKKYQWNRNGNEEFSYALSLSDLSVGEDIEKFINAGVVSFKIEGRMRRAEYVAAAVKYYKNILNNCDTTQDLSDLKRTYNRGNYTKGLGFGQDKRLLSTAVQGHIGEKVGVVKIVNGKNTVESKYLATDGDAFKILRDGQEIGGASFLKRERNGFTLFSKTRLKNGDGVFLTTDTQLNERLLQAESKGVLSLSIQFTEGERAIVKGGGVQVESSEILATAQSKALTVQEIRDCFLKTDGLPIIVNFEKIDLNGNIFIPKSLLNQLRRDYYSALCEKVGGIRGQLECLPFDKYKISGENGKTAVIADNFSCVQTDIAVFKAKNYQNIDEKFINGEFEKYLYYPPFCTKAEEEKLAFWINKYALDGLYIENYGGLQFAKELGVKVFLGTGLNITNSVSLCEWLKNESVAYYCISKELNKTESAPLIGEKAFVLASGNIKLIDLCYCPFGKTCARCDKKDVYILTDENHREFPVRRYESAQGDCRFEVYNCADLIGNGLKNTGKLLDLTLVKNKNLVLNAKDDAEKQKKVYKMHTSGHQNRGVL